MNKVCGHIDQLMKRLKSRGATRESVAPAIVSTDGDMICVDVDHPAYPRRVSLACVHRGDVVDLVECPTCSGSVKAKVHACALHGRCTLFAKPIDGVRSCRDCRDRNPAD